LSFRRNPATIIHEEIHQKKSTIQTIFSAEDVKVPLLWRDGENSKNF
jgi:hypothetical protein